MPNSLRILSVRITSSDSSKFDIFTCPVHRDAKIRALCEIDLSPDILMEPFNLSTFYIVNLIS